MEGGGVKGWERRGRGAAHPHVEAAVAREVIEHHARDLAPLADAGAVAEKKACSVPPREDEAVARAGLDHALKLQARQ